MDIAFTKTAKKQNWIRATRRDGTEVCMPWRTHPGLPHDAIHAVIERAFDLGHGFWGLFSAGVDFQVLTNATERSRTGEKVRDLVGRDTTELYQAEALVAVFANELLWSAPQDAAGRRAALAASCARWDVEVPARYADDRAIAAAAELRELAARWDQLAVGASLTIALHTT